MKKIKIASMICIISLCFISTNTNDVFAKSTKQEIAQAQQSYKEGFTAYKSDDIKTAAEGFMLASKTDKENPLYELFSADMLRMMKQYPSSIRYYLDSIDHIKNADKKQKDKILLKDYTGLSTNYIAINDTENAIKYAKKAISDFPKDYRGYYSLGNVYAIDKKTYTDAITQYNASIEANKEQLESYLALASIYNKSNDMDGVIATYKKACDYRPLDEAMKMSLAQVYFSYKDKDGKGHYKEAVSVLKDLINVNNKNAFAHYYLSLAYVLLDQKDLAEDELGIVNNLNPNLGQRLSKEIQAYYKKKNLNNKLNSTDSKTIDTIIVNANDVENSMETKNQNNENSLVSKQLEKMHKKESISV